MPTESRGTASPRTSFQLPTLCTTLKHIVRKKSREIHFEVFLKLVVSKDIYEMYPTYEAGEGALKGNRGHWFTLEVCKLRSVSFT